jgi:CRISPR-associated protein Cas1
MEIRQNTLFLTTPGLYIARDGLTLRVESENILKLAIPIHHLDSVCIFGPKIVMSTGALELCWENGASVNYFSETGYFIGRWEGVANTSVFLRRAQYKFADDPQRSLMISRQMVAGKIQNARQSLLRSARENDTSQEVDRLQSAAEDLAKQLRELQRAETIESIRGIEGIAARNYFDAFDFHLKQQREDFSFSRRSRRPPLDAVNCLLSYLYSLLLHDCIAALTAVGFDPYVGFLHEDRSNRPGLALDLMEEFRPALADRLVVTMINRKQISGSDFIKREGGAVEFADKARKIVITSYQTRKQDMIMHPLLNQECPIGHLFLIQARLLARHIRGDLENYPPFLQR